MRRLPVLIIGLVASVMIAEAAVSNGIWLGSLTRGLRNTVTDIPHQLLPARLLQVAHGLGIEPRLAKQRDNLLDYRLAQGRIASYSADVGVE